MATANDISARVRRRSRSKSRTTKASKRPGAPDRAEAGRSILNALVGVQASLVVASKVLLHQNVELDWEIALVLRAASDRLDTELSHLSAYLGVPLPVEGEGEVDL